MSKLLTVEEVATRLAVKPSWVRKQVQKNAIPLVRLGRYVRFEDDAIEAWIAEQRVGARGEQGAGHVLPEHPAGH